MNNKHLQQINIDGIANLLLHFSKAKTEEEFTEEESNGVNKFIAYLMDKWEESEYGDN